MKNLKNEKGSFLLVLCLILVIILFFLIVIVGRNKDNNDYYNNNYHNNNNNYYNNLETKTTSSFIKEDRTTYISKCRTIDYTSLARNPEQYKGNYYTFTGQVIQVMNDKNEVTLRVNVTPKHYTYVNETYYDDTILVYYKYSSSAESRILEKDIITIYGQSLGTYTYEAIFGNPITVPSVYAMYIDIKT